MSAARSTCVVAGIGAVAMVVTLAACGNSTSNDQPAQPPAATTPSAVQAAPHNQADVMFSQHMIPHHQQAIEMSDILLAKQGIAPRVVDMATQIKDAQAPEIQTMQGWLTEWGIPTMPMMPGGQMPGQPGMPGHGNMPIPGGPMGPGPGMGGMPMDGMMSQADMDALRNAQGVEAAKLFLTHMIAHHEGAIRMAQNEIGNGQHQPTIELSRSIVASQQQEIDTMRQILASL